MNITKKIFCTSIIVLALSGVYSNGIKYCEKHDGGNPNAECTCSTKL